MVDLTEMAEEGKQIQLLEKKKLKRVSANLKPEERKQLLLIESLSWKNQQLLKVWLYELSRKSIRNLFNKRVVTSDLASLVVE